MKIKLLVFLQVRYRKLDKNFKDESLIDLLRYLRDKQSRNRRMFRVVFKDFKMNIFLGFNKVLYYRGVVENYKCRFSLVVLERFRFQRGRFFLDVINLRGVNLESFMDGNVLVLNLILKFIEEGNQKYRVENEISFKNFDRR